MNTFHTSCAEAKRTNETFVQHVDVGGSRQPMEYQRPIVWLHESESKMVYLHGGREFKESGTYNDYYGFLTSMDQGEDAVGLCKTYKIEPTSSLELVILLSVFLRPCVETQETLAHNQSVDAKRRKRMYAQVPEDWRKEELRDGQTIWPRLENEVIATDVLVWSSKNTPEENDQLALNARALYECKEPAAEAVQ